MLSQQSGKATLDFKFRFIEYQAIKFNFGKVIMNAPNSGIDQRTEAERIYGWITDLCSQEGRLLAMLELCERRSQIESLGPLLWHSFGAVAGLLQEVSVLSVVSSNRAQEICQNS